MGHDCKTVTLRNDAGGIAIVNATDVGEWMARGYQPADGEPAVIADVEVVELTVATLAASHPLPPAVAVPPKRGRKPAAAPQG